MSLDLDVREGPDQRDTNSQRWALSSVEDNWVMSSCGGLCLQASFHSLCT